MGGSGFDMPIKQNPASDRKIDILRILIGNPKRAMGDGSEMVSIQFCFYRNAVSSINQEHVIDFRPCGVCAQCAESEGLNWRERHPVIWRRRPMFSDPPNDYPNSSKDGLNAPHRPVIIKAWFKATPWLIRFLVLAVSGETLFPVLRL